MRIRDSPLLTEYFAGWDEFRPRAGSVYVFGSSAEERSQLPLAWERALGNVTFIKLVEIAGDISRVMAPDHTGEKLVPVLLRSEKQLTELVDAFVGRPIYLDITGLSHHVWAPLMRAVLARRAPIRIVYVEPGEYLFSQTPTEGEIFDLSERIRGISPLPGFTSLAEPADEDSVCFVPLLGFEGTRLAYAVENVGPPGKKIVPVIGVPGFRPEYPFHSYLGNRSALEQAGAWKNVRFAIANCPFSLYYVLQDIAADYPRDLLKIAPIGTKPHAVGAVLYALTTSRRVELIYDHPIRKPQRTAGSDHILVYDVSSLHLVGEQ